MDNPKDAEQIPKSPVETQPEMTQSSVDKERETARKKEQERRRREAVSVCIHTFGVEIPDDFFSQPFCFPLFVDVRDWHDYAAGHHDYIWA